MLSKLREIKTLEEFKKEIGDPQVNWRARDKWNLERLQVGEWYRYDTTNLYQYHPLKNKHMKKCKLVYISSLLGNYGEAIFEGEEEKFPVMLEYLVPLKVVSLDEVRKARGKNITLFDFVEEEVV